MKINFTPKQKGFIQIPIIIALILGSVLVGGVWYSVVQTQKAKKVSDEKELQINQLAKEIESLKATSTVASEDTNKNTNTLIPPNAIHVPKQQDDGDTLKIAKCKAVYDQKINKIEDEINTNLVYSTKQIGEEMGIDFFTLFDEIKALKSERASLYSKLILGGTSNSVYEQQISSLDKQLTQKGNLVYAVNQALDQTSKAFRPKLEQQYSDEYLSCLNQ